MHWLDSRSAESFEFLARLANTPIYVFKDNNVVRVVGRPPFFQEVLDRRKVSVSPEGNGVKSCAFAKSSIDNYVFLFGPFRSGLGFSDEELKEPFEKLTIFNPKFQVLLDFAVSAIHSASMREVDDKLRLKQQGLVLEFLHHVGRITDSVVLLQKSAEFFVQKFHLSNAVFSAMGHVYRFFSNNRFDKEYSAVESVLLRQLADLRSVIKIDNVKTDFMLKGIKNLENVPRSIAAYPLLHDRQLLGSLVLYSDGFADLDLVPDVVSELVRLLVSADDFERVRTSARIDSLTRLYNRNYFVPACTSMINDMRIKNSSTTIILFDVDNFKKFNDTFGHPRGDAVLKAIGDIVLKSAPKSALCCRYGGEEFVVALPVVTQHEAADFAELLRSTVEKNCDLTISVGLITCINSSASFTDLIREADRALYKAKDLGKNCVVPFVMVDKNLGVIDTLNV